MISLTETAAALFGAADTCRAWVPYVVVTPWKGAALWSAAIPLNN